MSRCEIVKRDYAPSTTRACPRRAPHPPALKRPNKLHSYNTDRTIVWWSCLLDQVAYVFIRVLGGCVEDTVEWQ